MSPLRGVDRAGEPEGQRGEYTLQRQAEQQRCSWSGRVEVRVHGHVTYTNATGQGKYGGTMDVKKSRLVKWVMPAMMKNAANPTRTIPLTILIYLTQ